MTQAATVPVEQSGDMTHRQVLEALSGLLLGMFVAILAGTVVATSLPLIIADLGGDQAFAWIGTAAFGNVAGQLRSYQSGGNTYVTGDVNGDGVGDFQIEMDPLVTLAASNFIL